MFFCEESMHFYYKVSVMSNRDLAVFEKRNPNGSQLPEQGLNA